MLVNELITSQRLIDHAHNTHGVIWREFEIKEKKRETSAKKQDNGLTIRQNEIVEFIHKNQPCRATDLTMYLGIPASSIDSKSPLVSKGLIQQDPKTAMWYNPKNKPSVIRKPTLTEQIIDHIKSNKNVRPKDLKYITHSARVILTKLKKQGLIVNDVINHHWNWAQK